MITILNTIKKFLNGRPAAIVPSTPTRVVAPVSKIDLSSLLTPGPAAKKAEVVLSAAVVAPAATVILNEDERPIDAAEEIRTDSEMRTPGRIAYLLRYEDAAATARRIANDSARYRRSKS